MNRFVRVWVCTVGCVLAPAWVSAQISSASVAGVVRDTTGSVLPGVTVEARSPVLIEGVRTALTDGTGQYRIVELRPGTYVVTFTLPGFTGVKREGLELTAGFTATVNAELRVGDVAETITVTGETPVVDVQNVRTVEVLSRETLDTIPTGREFQSVVLLIPGVSANFGADRDVGGQLGQTFGSLAIHGGSARDQQLLVDGSSLDGATTRSTAGCRVATGNNCAGCSI